MKKLYQFPYGPHSGLNLGYTRVVLDDKSQAEIDEDDALLMALVERYNGEPVKPEIKTRELPPVKEIKVKKDGDK